MRSPDKRSSLQRGSVKYGTHNPRMNEELKKLQVTNLKEYEFLEEEFKPVRISDQMLDNRTKVQSIVININTTGDLTMVNANGQFELSGINFELLDVDQTGQMTNFENSNWRVKEALIEKFKKGDLMKLTVVREISLMYKAVAEIEIEQLNFEIKKKLEKLRK